jgi:hypothetical protein
MPELPIRVYTPEPLLGQPVKMLREMMADLWAGRELAWRLGAGFNPILTGRENTNVNGSVPELSKRELDARCDGSLPIRMPPDRVR